MNLLKFFLNKEKLFRDIPQLINPVKHIKKQANNFISKFLKQLIFKYFLTQKTKGGIAMT